MDFGVKLSYLQNGKNDYSKRKAVNDTISLNIQDYTQNFEIITDAANLAIKNNFIGQNNVNFKGILNEKTQSKKTETTNTVVRSPEKTAYINSSPLLEKYCKKSDDKYEFCGKNYYFFYINQYKKERLNVLDELDISEFGKIEKRCEEIEKRCKELDINDLDSKLKFLIDLSYFDEDAYKYMLNSDKLLKKFLKDGTRIDIAYKCIKDMNVNILKEIEKERNNQLINRYVTDSDTFQQNFNDAEVLSELISKNKIEGDIVVKRGERTVGMFNDVPLNDKLFEKKIKLINFFKQIKTKKDKFAGFKRSYSATNETTKKNIYEYISKKKNLSLADAMLMMPYLSSKDREKVLKLIKGCTINENDNRFKSGSFSDEFPYDWISSSHNFDNQPRMIHKMTLKKGTEGIYVGARDRQFEFIINNKDKNITINDVSYDEESNRFNIESTLEMKN